MNTEPTQQSKQTVQDKINYHEKIIKTFENLKLALESDLKESKEGSTLYCRIQIELLQLTDAIKAKKNTLNVYMEHAKRI